VRPVSRVLAASGGLAALRWPAAGHSGVPPAGVVGRLTMALSRAVVAATRRGESHLHGLAPTAEAAAAMASAESDIVWCMCLARGTRAFSSHGALGQHPPQPWDPWDLLT